MRFENSVKAQSAENNSELHSRQFQTSWVLGYHPSFEFRHLDLYFFGHNLDHERSDHHRIRVLLRLSQIGAQSIGEALIDSAHLRQAREIDFNECCRPLPHVVSRSDAKDV